MNTPDFYYAIPDAPKEITSGTVLARLIDGLGFRYRWATDDLKEENLSFRACESSMNIYELTQHIYNLIYFTARITKVSSLPNFNSSRPFKELNADILSITILLRNHFIKINDSDLLKIVITSPDGKTNYPFWNLINGQMADILTHIGQINGLRRQAGNPCRQVNYFIGQP